MKSFDDIQSLLTQARAKGTDKQFRKFVQKQPSCITRKFSEWLPDIGEWRNPSCHVRRAGKSGTSFKEDYACVAMTHDEHRLQSNQGEAACLNYYHPHKHDWTNDEAKRWFDMQRIVMLQLWLES